MKGFVCLLLLCMGTVSAQELDLNTITGIVTDGRTPIENVKIEIKETEQRVYTDANGRYTIEAAPGSVLVFSYTGFKTIQIYTEEVTRILNIELFPDIQELDEVTVTKSRRKSQQELELEYNDNSELIRSAYGILDATTSAYPIRILDKNRITDIRLCILGLLRNQFPGIAVVGECSKGGSVYIRGNSSINYNQAAVFDIDGLILNDAPVWIPVGSIKRIAVLSSLAARNLYGGIATGGVIIINTDASVSYAQSKELRDKARLRNNMYNGDAIASNNLDKDLPVYLQELHKSNSFESARDIYEYYADRYAGNYSYGIDALMYFYKTWQQREFIDGLVQHTYNSFQTNPVALKALSYVLQANGDFKEAFEVNREIFIQRPNYAQSYMDLANNYRDLGESKTSASLYSRYGYLVEKGFLAKDSTAFSAIVQREFSNLIALKGREIISRSVNKYMLNDDFEGTRLVFEWNDSEAEFDLQFVNPEGHYYTWRHSIIANADRINDEKKTGFSCEEYLIDKSLPGEWQINVKYLGNKSLTPSYLKVTTYTNYGKENQQKSIQIFKLGLKNVNQQLFRLNNVIRTRL